QRRWDAPGPRLLPTLPQERLGRTRCLGAAAGFSAPPAPRRSVSGRQRLAVAFFAALRAVEAFLVAGRLAAGPLEVAFLEADFLVDALVDFLAVDFLAVDFLAVDLAVDLAAGAGGHTPRASLGARLVFA